ncbi:MAG: hypothetical protein HW390_141 [Candidatus Brocadiaceae bacterium]|nr:hypothetical protein [Candidatus Brocadiaceae bacterium]
MQPFWGIIFVEMNKLSVGECINPTFAIRLQKLLYKKYFRQALVQDFREKGLVLKFNDTETHEKNE